MIDKNFKQIIQVSLGIMLILSVMQIMPFGMIVENVSGGSSWVQTTDTDFSNGTLENLLVNGSGTNAEVRLVKDGLEKEYDVDGNTIALWHFNETSGSTAYDETSYNNDGTIYGASRVEGKFGNGLQFNGINDWVDCGNDSSLNITDEITIDAWVNGSGADFSSMKRTTGNYEKAFPRLQVVGSKIYYAWWEDDGINYQIWTAEMNTNGTGFLATQRTFSPYDKGRTRFQVVGNKIYYVWWEYDLYWQIWTAEMNTNGTGFSATKRTTSPFDKEVPKLQVVGSKIYYVWHEGDGSYDQIWTAEMNTNGTGFSATKITTSANYTQNPQFQVVGDKIYYVWEERDPIYWQIWTAEMNTDGTGFSATKRTTSAYYKQNPQLQVVGSKIFYIWFEFDGSYYQIWTAEMNTDGTGFSATKRTDSTFHNQYPQLQVVGSKIYYVWHEYDGSNYQIWTAEMNTDGTGFSATKRTTSANYKQNPQLQVVGSKIYYVWRERDASQYQIQTAEMNSNIVNKGDFYGLGISGNTIQGFINAGLDGIKYNTQAINYTDGATVESTLDSNWNHITMTYDKSNLKLYINGVLVDTSSFAEAINVNPFDLIIGDNFNGAIDEVRISNIARIPGFFPTGSFTSTILDTGSNSNFTTINWNPTSQPPNTDLKFQVATNKDASTWNFVGPDGTSNTNYTIASGQSIWIGHNEDRYLRYKAYLSTTNVSVTPTLKDVTIIYNCLPSTLLTNPSNGSAININTPSFYWDFNDLDSGAVQSSFQVLIDDDNDFGSVNYDSGKQSLSNEYWQFPDGTSYSTITDGTWHWKVRAQDSDGDWGVYSAARVIIIDTQEPNSLPFVPVNDGVYNNLINISGGASDSGGSGINKVEICIKQLSNDYYWDGSSWYALRTWLLASGSENWFYNSSSVSWTSGIQYTIQSRATDNVSNIETPSSGSTFTFDTDEPSSIITIPVNGAYLNSLPTISGTASDNGGSGITEVRISIEREGVDEYWDGSGWVDSETWLTTSGTTSWSYDSSSINWSIDTNYTIRSQAIDNATNEETPSGGITFLFDDQAPTSLSISINNGDEYATSPSVILSLNAEDSGSGVHQMAFRLDGENWTDWESYNTSKSYMLLGGEGSKTVYFRVIDEAGNIAPYVFDDIILDTTSPVVTDTLTGTDVEVTEILTITFSEPMNHTSVENAITILPDVSILNYNWDGNTLTITFSSDLSYDTEYAVTIGTGAEDLAGNAMETPYSWQFTTKAEPEEGFPLVWLIILLVIIIIIVLLLAWLLMRRKPEEPEEAELEEGEVVPPPPPKKAKIAELLEEEEAEEDAEEEAPPPPKKAMIEELSDEEEEAEKEVPPPKAKRPKKLSEEELDRLDLPEPDEEF